MLLKLELFYGLTPSFQSMGTSVLPGFTLPLYSTTGKIDNHADGTKVWEKYFGITGIALTTITLLSSITYWTSLIWMFKKYIDAKIILHANHAKGINPI